MERILEVKDLKKYYGKKDFATKALDGISFQVMNGEFIGIMGSSGSGKTTLLNCI
ncbi:MAG TPA: ABC transporter, partial [Clostridium sp.]|nr:ABC transporter [Clostridium sp.]